MARTKFRFIAPLLAAAAAVASYAQVPTPMPAAPEEILRVDTKLIQTGFQVFGRRNEPITGMTKSDFELQVDGKPVEIKFFEEIGRPEGSAASPSGRSVAGEAVASPATSPRRTIVFVVDDLHLSAPNLIRTRRMLQKFIEEKMLPNDRVAVVSSGGKVGFLQQFTSDRDVLNAAVSRLVNGMGTSSEEERPPKMDEYAAQMIARGDREVTDYYVAATMRIERITLPGVAMNIVQNRARNIMSRAEVLTNTSLSALEASVRAGAVFPGRKLIQFISDGFLLDPGNTDSGERLKSITDAAVRSNTVINSFDAKGLDASMPEIMGGMTTSLASGSRIEKQDGLNYVANNTGGRFVHNTNDISGELAKATSEAFHYYLFAWEPEEDPKADTRLRKIEIKVLSKPELKVRAHRGFLTAAARKAMAAAIEKNAANTAARPSAEVRIPAVLSTRYIETVGAGPAVSVSLQIGLGSASGKRAEMQIDWEILDSSGNTVKKETKPLSLNLPDRRQDQDGELQFNHDYDSPLKPGLYQIKAAIRDLKTGKKGAAAGWVEVPDVVKQRIALSGIILGEGNSLASERLSRKIVNRFSRESTLHYAVFAYVAPQKSGEPPPELTLRTSIVQARKPLSSFVSKLVVPQAAEVTGIPYKGEMNLKSLAPGSYELVIMLHDGQGKRSDEKRVSFDVE